MPLSHEVAFFSFGFLVALVSVGLLLRIALKIMASNMHIVTTKLISTIDSAQLMHEVVMTLDEDQKILAMRALHDRDAYSYHQVCAAFEVANEAAGKRSH
jgi:hypothetical protein